MERLALLKNLMMMAAADGSLTEREINFLTERCTSWGLDEEAFTDVLESVIANRDDLVIQLPKSRDKSVELLQELVRMMAADGELAENEKHLFAIAAAQLHITGDDLNKIIDDVLDS